MKHVQRIYFNQISNMLNQISEQKIDRLAKLLNDLADPTRMRIILGLTKPASMNALQEHLKIGQTTLAKHLTQMQVNGFLNSQRHDGEVFYSLTDNALHKAVHLLLTREIDSPLAKATTRDGILQEAE